MSGEIRLLKVKVEANYQILAAGLTALRKELHEGNAELREGLDAQGAAIAGLQHGVKELAQGVQELADGSQQLQHSIGRTARQQDALAQRLDSRMDGLVESMGQYHTNLIDSLEVMARHFDELEDLRRRVEDLEEWRRGHTG